MKLRHAERCCPSEGTTTTTLPRVRGQSPAVRSSLSPMPARRSSRLCTKWLIRLIADDTTSFLFLTVTGLVPIKHEFTVLVPVGSSYRISLWRTAVQSDGAERERERARERGRPADRLAERHRATEGQTGVAYTAHDREDVSCWRVPATCLCGHVGLRCSLRANAPALCGVPGVQQPRRLRRGHLLRQ